MKTRSVIKSGNCLVVTIPMEFVKGENLTKESVLKYEIVGHKLTLSAVNMEDAPDVPEIFH